MAALRGLVKSPGWDLLVEQAREAVMVRNDLMGITQSAQGEADTMQRVFQARGEVLGINHILGLPEALAEQIQELIDENVGDDGHAL